MMDEYGKFKQNFQWVYFYHSVSKYKYDHDEFFRKETDKLKEGLPWRKLKTEKQNH